jgi:uncharacterized protein (TIGR02246 family)
MTSTPAVPTREIEAVVGLLESGWNSRDARRYASAFTQTHDYVAVGGRLTLGQDLAANAAIHDRIWRELYAEGCTIRLEVLKVARLADDVCMAIISNHEAVVQNGIPVQRASVITAVLVQEDREWRIAQFNNNPIVDPAARP